MFIISLFLLVALTLQVDNVSVNFKTNKCKCGQIVSQLDCTLANRCSWDSTSSSCKTQQCSSIMDQYSCSMVSDCYWNFQTAANSIASACTEISGCANINFNSSYPYTCSQQNIFCSEPFNTTLTTGPCIDKTRVFTQTQCTQITNSSLCVANSLACKWEPASSGSGSCQPITCANLRTQQDCLYYSNSTLYTTINLCTWVNDNCIPATSSQIAKYSYNQCFLNTLGTYTFSSNNIDDKGNFEGTCQSCYHYIISAFIALLALFM